MLNINELERLTGITRQNIRFYKKKGLLYPKRNSLQCFTEYLKLIKRYISKLK